MTTVFTIFFTAETQLWIVLAVLFSSGFSHGLWNVPNNSTILGSVPVASYGVIGAFTNLTRNLANVIGQAVASTVVVAVMVSRGFDIPLSDIADSEGGGLAFNRRMASRVHRRACVIGRRPDSHSQNQDHAHGRKLTKQNSGER